MNVKLSSRDFLFHRIINMRDTKAKFPQSSITRSKTKEYSYDVQNKIIELHKIESGCNKIAKALKMAISTIRAIIKKFQSAKDVTNLPGRECVSISS